MKRVFTHMINLVESTDQQKLSTKAIKVAIASRESRNNMNNMIIIYYSNFNAHIFKQRIPNIQSLMLNRVM